MVYLPKKSSSWLAKPLRMVYLPKKSSSWLAKPLRMVYLPKKSSSWLAKSLRISLLSSLELPLFSALSSRAKRSRNVAYLNNISYTIKYVQL
jgi:hypothetical protein